VSDLFRLTGRTARWFRGQLRHRRRGHGRTALRRRKGADLRAGCGGVDPDRGGVVRHRCGRGHPRRPGHAVRHRCLGRAGDRPDRREAGPAGQQRRHDPRRRLPGVPGAGVGATFDLNVKAVHYLTTALVPLLRAARPADPAQVVYLRSMDGIAPMTGNPAYGAKGRRPRSGPDPRPRARRRRDRRGAGCLPQPPDQ